nr:regulatory protein RecX [Echinimonas agarilytica]
MQQAVKTAVDLLSRRDHCRRELLTKLHQRGFPQTVAVQALNRCENERWLCETRFAESYVRIKAGKGYGPSRIRQELLMKDVSELDVEAGFRALCDDEHDWFESAKNQRIKHFGHMPASESKLRQKQQRYLFNRGFTSEQIRYACNDE